MFLLTVRNKVYYYSYYISVIINAIYEIVFSNFSLFSFDDIENICTSCLYHQKYHQKYETLASVYG